MSLRFLLLLIFFFFNDPATTEIYTLSLHDALPICSRGSSHRRQGEVEGGAVVRIRRRPQPSPDRKSTRLNSSHRTISYAVFCLKKKKKNVHSQLYQRATMLLMTSSLQLYYIHS